MQPRSGIPRPPVVWLEGVLDYFNAPFPHDRDDLRRIGYGVGRQIIGLYLSEMLLKYALDDRSITYVRNHDLHELFNRLPQETRSAVEDKYSQILRSYAGTAWDVAESVDSLLAYLGPDPFNDSRYFWEADRPEDSPLLFMGETVRTLVYALFVVLHGYPEGGQPGHQQDTEFMSLRDSLQERQEPPPDHTMDREGKRITASIWWLSGLVEYFQVPFPHEPDDPRALGFQVGQRIVGLVLIEMALKYALDDLGASYRGTHNLFSLFRKLPRPRRRGVERKYLKLLHASVEWTLDYARSVESLLQHAGRNPVTATRYFWERNEEDHIPLSAWPLRPVVLALLVELHGYPQGPLPKRYDTVFRPLDESRSQP